MTKVKICGITNLEDALLSAKFGADALGFNFYEKSPRYIPPEKAREICLELPPQILKVGVFVNESLNVIIEIAASVPLDAVQLHGDETAEFVRLVKENFSGETIKALRVSENFQPEDVLKFNADAILLDAYSKHEYGGTGETFDWGMARKVQKIFPKMYLAGGLKPKNIENAIMLVSPFGIDICSGVESQKGKKDYALLYELDNIVRDVRQKEINHIYEFLQAVRKRPWMWIGEKSLTKLWIFLDGFYSGMSFGNKFDTKKFFSTEFNEWVDQKVELENSNSSGWVLNILRKTNNDEELAYDLFFALLEEFKSEKENLSSK